MQNAIKLENISNLITSPSSYQCRKTTVNMKVSEFCYSWPTHINGMLQCIWYVCVLGIPKCKFSKQMIKKYLVTEYLFVLTMPTLNKAYLLFIIIIYSKVHSSRGNPKEISTWASRVLHQTPSNRIPAALRQTPSDWIHVVLWQTPSDWIFSSSCSWSPYPTAIVPFLLRLRCNKLIRKWK
jgi:hypothetical protein